MTDAETRAELNRLGLIILHDLKCKCDTCNALRLLAESQQALGEIIEGKWTESGDRQGASWSELKAIEIAKNACKEEYRGPKAEPILPVSLKCKCGYVLKPQDKSCPNCDKLFGKAGGFNG